MGRVFDVVRDVNRALDRGPLGDAARAAVLDFVAGVDDVLGVLPLVDRARAATVSDDDRELLEARIAARHRRDFAASDRIREELRGRGIVVEDTAEGQRWHRAG